MKNILLLTDFSKNANNAIDYAMKCFNGETIKFYVLNVQKVSRYITSDLIVSPKKSIYESIIKNPKKSLGLVIDALKEKYNNEDYYFEGICDYDSFISAVKQVVEIKNIDLIVMGTNGASGIKETVFGSNTVQIVKTIDLPILVVPEDYNYNTPHKILFINEIDNIVGKTITVPLNHLISKYNSKLFVLSSNKINENSNDLFTGITPDYIEVGDKRIENRIENIITDNNIDLIAKVVHTKSFFERIFSSSTSKITYLSKIPILFL